MSSGKTFDERLRDIGNGKQADDLLIATHKEPKDPNQPAGISFSEYRSIKLDADRQIRKVRKWRMISIFLLIAVISLSIFSAYIYEARYTQGVQEKYHEILTYPDQYHLVHVSNALNYVISTYSLEEIAAQYGTKTESGTSSTSVYVTQSGSKYHKSDCRILKGKDGVTEYAGSEEAEKHGYSACEICNQ